MTEQTWVMDSAVNVKVHRLNRMQPVSDYQSTVAALARVRPIIGRQVVYPDINVVDLIQRNRIPGTLVISERCTAFTEEAMKSRKRSQPEWNWRIGMVP